MARHVKSRAKVTYTRVQRAKDAARAAVGPPPPTRVQPDPKKKRLADPRHRETLDRLLQTDIPPETSRSDAD